MDSQINLTQLRINATKEQITGLTDDIKTASSKIDHLQGSINNLTKVLLNRIVATYKMGSIPPVQILAASVS